METRYSANKAYWDRRFGRTPKGPSPTELVADLNRRMEDSPDGAEGIRFSITRVLGQETVTWQGPAAAKSFVRQILLTVTSDVVMPIPFQVDPLNVPPPSSGDRAPP